MQRESFVFYRSFFEAIESLPKTKQLEVYRAIAQFALDGTEPQISGISAAIFSMARPTIEKNQKKYENGCKGAKSGFLGAEYGKRGGRPPKNNPPKPPQETPHETPQKPPYTDTVTDTVTDTEKNIKKITTAGLYPQSVDDVLAIAASPLCGMRCSREQAEAYFTNRAATDWEDAARRKITPGNVPLDIKRWLMRDEQKKNAPQYNNKQPKDYYSNGNNLSNDPADFTRCDEV